MTTPETSRLTAETLELDDDPEALFVLSLEQGWGDGAPILPPTDERIARLLAARRLSLALELFESAHDALPGVTVARPDDLRTLASHARATGRVRFAERLEAGVRAP